MTIGSSVAISASGLARLGTATALVGVVGDDAFGDFMLASLQRRGVDVEPRPHRPRWPDRLVGDPGAA